MSQSRSKRRKLERDLKKGKTVSSLEPYQLLYEIKYRLNEIQSSTLLNSIPQKTKAYFEGGPLPKSYQELRSTGETYIEDLILKEIAWYEDKLISYSTEINSFISISLQFEKEILIGAYDKADATLNLIEESICISHWSVEGRLILSEYQNGFKKNKEVLASIIQPNNNQIVNVFARHQSTRVEKNLSQFNYEEILNRYLQLHDDQKLREYLLFKLNYYKNLSYNYHGYFLAYDNNASIVDRYRSFMTVCISLLSDANTDKAIIDRIIKAVEHLSEQINDQRLLNILIVMGSEYKVNSTINPEFVSVLDLYTAARYSECYQRGVQFLKSNPDNFDTYEVVIKSMINSSIPFQNPFDNDSLAGRAFDCLFNIVLKNEKTRDSLLESQKIFSLLGESCWSYKYFTYINNEYLISHPKFNYFKYSFLNSNYVNPSLAIFIEKKQNALSFLNSIVLNEESNTVLFWTKIIHLLIGKSVELDKKNFREQLYGIKIKQSLGNYSQAYLEYAELQENPLFKLELGKYHNTEDVLGGQLICLINLNRLNDALNLITTSVIKNPNGLNKIGYGAVLEAIRLSESSEIESNISSPIFLHQYQQPTNDIWIAYDDFLSSLNISFPHEIVNHKDKFAKEKLVYFMRYVCKQEIYDSSYMFENQDDLDNERIEICLLLTELDPDQFSIYIDEISAISRGLLIRKGIKQIDESKIYVDLVGIRKTLEKDLRESFNRSLELSAIPLEQISKISLEDTGKILVPYYGKSKESQKIEFKKESLKITSWKRYELFADMFYKVRDTFVASSEYGLETYLSMRIRHGTLLGEIRSVFENLHLITKKDSSTGKYQNNKYWLNKFHFKSEAKKENFNMILAKFSETIDNISEEIKNKKLQITNEKKISEGLFDYTYDKSNNLLSLFREQLGAIEDYDEFIETVFDELWGRTEDNLLEIRNCISGHIKPSLISLLSELVTDLEDSFNRAEYPDLNELTRSITECQTSVAVEFDKISQWFRRTNSKTINEFFFDLPLDASLATIRRIFPRFSVFSPTITNVSTTKFEGEFFTQFSDLIQILLHNIIKHSQLDPGDLKCEMRIYEKEDVLTLQSQNNIASNVDLIGLNNQINEAKASLSLDHGIEAIRTEDRSGYLKIRKILKSGLNCEHYSIQLSNVGEDRIFRTVVSFGIDHLKKIIQNELASN